MTCVHYVLQSRRRLAQLPTVSVIEKWPVSTLNSEKSGGDHSGELGLRPVTSVSSGQYADT